MKFLSIFLFIFESGLLVSVYFIGFGIFLMLFVRFVCGMWLSVEPVLLQFIERRRFLISVRLVIVAAMHLGVCLSSSCSFSIKRMEFTFLSSSYANGRVGYISQKNCI